MKQKGLVTELYCQLEFSKLGIVLSKPISEDCRYDFIADVNNHLIRIQCKTCSVSEDKSYIRFAARSIRSNTKGNDAKSYSKNEIDYFYTYYDNKSYLVKVEEASSTKNLRFFSNNNQNTNISWAKDYELEKILLNDFDYIPKYNTINIISNNNLCIDCGVLISKESLRCRKCENLHRIQPKQIPREELKNLIRTMPFTQIGKQFNITDNAIRKWCDAYNLPRTKKEINSYTDEEWRQV